MIEQEYWPGALDGLAEELLRRADLLERAVETVAELVDLDAGEADLHKVAIAVLTSIGEWPPTTT